MQYLNIHVHHPLCNTSIITEPQQYQILCVDDIEDNCDLFNFILTEAGYKVKLAQSVKQACEIFKDSEITLCVFDLFLPDGTGFELLEKVRKVDSSTPVIITSGYGYGLTEKYAIEIGAQAFFTKPINFDLLLEKIAQIIESSCAY